MIEITPVGAYVLGVICGTCMGLCFGYGTAAWYFQKKGWWK